MFKGCKQEDMPPHIYSYTQSIYRNMLSTRIDHSIILTGHSGSGKTSNTKHILDYLSKTNSNNKELINDSKINAMFSLLEAFCCIQTTRNEISNRFINVFLLEFGNTGQIVSLLLQVRNEIYFYIFSTCVCVFLIKWFFFSFFVFLYVLDRSVRLIFYNKQHVYFI